MHGKPLDSATADGEHGELHCFVTAIPLQQGRLGMEVGGYSMQHVVSWTGFSLAHTLQRLRA